jgi:anti-anti-sigma factor
MEMNIKKENNISIITVKGRMDAVSSPVFEKDISALIAHGENTFIINLSSLEYISSAGLRSILTVAKKLKKINGELIFTGLQGTVEEVFKISGFQSLFKLYETEEKALKKT